MTAIRNAVAIVAAVCLTVGFTPVNAQPLSGPPAIDRTTLAWIRTALTSAAFGFGLIGVFRTIAPMAQSQEAKRLHEAAIYLAVAMVAIGMVGAILSAVSHWASLRKLHRGEELSAHRWPFAITAAAVVAMLGLYALWTVVTA